MKDRGRAADMLPAACALLKAWPPSAAVTSPVHLQAKHAALPHSSSSTAQAAGAVMLICSREASHIAVKHPARDCLLVASGAVCLSESLGMNALVLPNLIGLKTHLPDTGACMLMESCSSNLWFPV